MCRCSGLGIASLLIALLVRVLFTFVCVLCAGFNLKEKVFIALAWMPKATVQVCAFIFLSFTLLSLLVFVVHINVFLVFPLIDG